MCKQGTTKILNIKGRPCDIDSCLYELVKLLNENGYETIACCCGHERQPANIALRDGREFIIARNFKEARKIDECLKQ